MRADRLLSILLLLQKHQRMTAGELARRLEVTERTIYRDIEALSTAGIPVYTERGSGGGCFLPNDYRTITSLTEAELQALLVSPSKLLNDLGLKRASESVLELSPHVKVVAPEELRQRVVFALSQALGLYP